MLRGVGVLIFVPLRFRPFEDRGYVLERMVMITLNTRESKFIGDLIECVVI